MARNADSHSRPKNDRVRQIARCHENRDEPYDSAKDGETDGAADHIFRFSTVEDVHPSVVSGQTM
jgi:hypothetical protein